MKMDTLESKGLSRKSDLKYGVDQDK